MNDSFMNPRQADGGRDELRPYTHCVETRFIESVFAPFGQIVDLIQDPLLVIDRFNVIQLKNEAAQKALSAQAGLSEEDGRLTLAPPGDAQLRSVIGDAFSRHFEQGRQRAFVVPSGAGTEWIALVSSLSRPPESGQSAQRFLIHLVGRVHSRTPRLMVLQDVFGFTHRELDLVGQLLRHESLQVIATRMAVSRETLKTHLKRIFRKCEASSQSDLIAMVQEVASFAP